MGTSSKEDGSRKRLSRRKSARKLRDLSDAIKQAIGCEECGYSKHPAALDYDHIDPSKKEFNIAQAIGAALGKQRILDEIAKCRVLCANCHRIHSYETHPTRVGTT